MNLAPTVFLNFNEKILRSLASSVSRVACLYRLLQPSIVKGLLKCLFVRIDKLVYLNYLNTKSNISKLQNLVTCTLVL